MHGHTNVKNPSYKLLMSNHVVVIHLWYHNPTHKRGLKYYKKSRKGDPGIKIGTGTQLFARDSNT